jgi:exonuclease III
MRFGTWNVRSLYRSGSLMTVARELARYKLDLVGIQEVRWDKGGTVRAGDYTFSMEKVMKVINWEEVFLYIREYYQQLREESLSVIGCHIWCSEVAGVISLF